MKATRRLAALAAAATMTACMAIPMVAMNVSAAEQGTIIITETASSSTLKAFQIFTADVTTTGEDEEKTTTFTVTGWGNGIDVDKLGTALKASTVLVTENAGSTTNDFANVTFASTAASAQAVADVLSQYGDNNNSAKVEAFAKIAAACTKGNGTGGTTSTTETTSTVSFLVDQGYYIVVDSSAASNGSYSAYTLGILKVLGGENATATVKRDFPTFDKKIGDINDTTDTAGEYTFNEAADHDIGDDVPFQLIATLPSNIDKYTAYSLKFYDDLQATVFALNANSIKVTYTDSDDSAVDVTTAFTVVSEVNQNEGFTEHTDGNQDFTVASDNIKTIEGITLEAGGKFMVEYTAKLTENANLGATGNWNGAYLQYSNNPNWDGTPGSDTDKKDNSPVDYVVAFTYQAIVNKIDGITGAPLAGAEFTLYKKLKDGTMKKVETVANNSAETSFEFKGLDDGDYVLKETTVPGGYSGAADIEFTITAIETQTDGSEALKEFRSSNNAVTAGNVFTLNIEDDTYEAGDVLGAVSATVENKKGSSLPSTGGIGTTIFYVVGSLMVGVAGVYLIAKKRMNNNEQ